MFTLFTSFYKLPRYFIHMEVKGSFVNLPVKDLKKSTQFFERLGFISDSQFSDEKATALILGNQIYCMLLSQEFFKTFIKKKIVDAKKSTASIQGFSLDDKKKVDEIFEKAISAGATKANEPYDYGFMYGKSFYDLDGHMWEFFWLDKSKMSNK